MDEPIVCAGPNRIRILERRSNRINRASVLASFRIARRKGAKIRGHLVRFTRQVRADNAPTPPLVGRFEQHVRRKIQGLRIEAGKNQRKRAVIAILAAAHRLGSNIRDLAEVLAGAGELRAINNVRIAWIDSHAAIFENTRNAPIAERYFTVVAAALRRDATRFLLAAVDPVGEAVVGRDVKKLRGRLVVPAAPGLASIHADDRALVGGKCDGLRVFRADPDALIIVAARRAFPSYERFATVG